MIIGACDLATTTGLAILTDGKLTFYGKQSATTCDDIELIAGCFAACDLVAIENVYCGANVATAIQLATLRGRLIQALDRREIKWVLVSPSTWRKATFHPKPKTKRKELKQQCQAWTLSTYGVAVSEDESDAIGIATWAAQKAESRQLSETHPEARQNAGDISAS